MPYRVGYVTPGSDKFFYVQPWHCYVVVAELRGKKKRLNSVQVRLPLTSPDDNKPTILTFDDLNKVKEVVKHKGHMIIYSDVWTCATVERDEYFIDFIGIHPYTNYIGNAAPVGVQMEAFLRTLSRFRKPRIYVEFFETGPAIHSEKLMELAGDIDERIEKFKLEAERTGKLPRAFAEQPPKKTFDYPGWRQLPGMANYGYQN